MSGKGKITRVTFIVLLIAALSLIYCCAPKDPADIATQLAQEWAANNVDTVSGTIASLTVSNNPLIEKAVAMAITREINDKISWEYSQPQQLADERYRIVATASSAIELPLLGSYRLSVNYNLEIDTRQKQVTNATIDAGSFSMRKQ